MTETHTEQLKRMTRRPTSPGEMVAGLLEELEMTQTELAERIGVSRATVNRLVRGRNALTADMANRLGRAFGDGAGIWIRLKAQVELWDALHADQSAYCNIQPLSETSKPMKKAA